MSSMEKIDFAALDNFQVVTHARSFIESSNMKALQEAVGYLESYEVRYLLEDAVAFDKPDFFNFLMLLYRPSAESRIHSLPSFLSMAIEKGSLNILSFCLENFKCPASVLSKIFSEAARSGHAEALKVLMPFADARSTSTALVSALQSNGESSVLSTLLEKVNRADLPFIARMSLEKIRVRDVSSYPEMAQKADEFIASLPHKDFSVVYGEIHKIVREFYFPAISARRSQLEIQSSVDQVVKMDEVATSRQVRKM